MSTTMSTAEQIRARYRVSPAAKLRAALRAREQQQAARPAGAVEDECQPERA